MSRMIENLVNAAVQVLEMDVFRDPRECVDVTTDKALQSALFA
jgi:hypothetical protein